MSTALPIHIRVRRTCSGSTASINGAVCPWTSTSQPTSNVRRTPPKTIKINMKFLICLALFVAVAQAHLVAPVATYAAAAPAVTYAAAPAVYSAAVPRAYTTYAAAPSVYSASYVSPSVYSAYAAPAVVSTYAAPAVVSTLLKK
ncbi:PREDICTED: pupal cuticle protein C1B [Drosophila arizonae]|nr:PREDICTED: pupal cuticle protein C1B [Drosophila arizonae]